MDNFVTLKRGSKEVKTQILTGEINKETIRNAFLLEDNVPIALYKGDTNLLSNNGIFNLGNEWRGETYLVEWDEERRSRPTTPMMIETRPTTPQINDDYMHNMNLVDAFIFYINENGAKSCVVALTQHFLVTFRHGTHQSYVKDATLVRVVSVKSGVEYEATVSHINEEEDYVILRSNEEVVNRNCPIQECGVMKPFVVCGFGKGFPQLTFIRGTVYSIYPFVYEKNGKPFGPFVYGTAKTSRGDSGAACFGTFGLMAINLGITSMPLTNHADAISESAIFSPNNFMVPALRLVDLVAKLEPKRPPKRTYRGIDIEGYGKFEF